MYRTNHQSVFLLGIESFCVFYSRYKDKPEIFKLFTVFRNLGFFYI